MGGLHTLRLIGGDATDQIFLDGLTAQDILDLTDSEDDGHYYRRIDYTGANGQPTWTSDAYIIASTDDNLPGWMIYSMGFSTLDFVPEGLGYRPEYIDKSDLTVAIYGFEAGDYGLPELWDAPDPISNAELRTQMLAVTDTGLEWWQVTDELAYTALSSNTVWDSLFV